ncbi:helix-turn-helix domain-containing protein [Acidiphilium sp. AL]|uniref:helix-turn-helix domain-containing protein n=1 Tax=Acidiphilium sp. AL TaxID=2871704 RepID=UPI0021CAF45E|nr:helix-turn-helix domain-containing protein [Acidiphilium sp. AL]
MDGDRDTGVNTPDFHDSDLHGPARVGAELRAVRERLGWTLTDLARRLKIRLPFLEAIEAGDLAALPAPAYAAGFIRSYAEAMGLDPEEILRRFRAEGMSRAKQPVLSFPEPVPDRAVPPGAIVFLAVVIAVGAYFLWYRHSEHELRMAQMVPAVPAKLAPLAVPKPPPPAKPKPAKSAPAVTAPASAAGSASSMSSSPGSGSAGPVVTASNSTTTQPTSQTPQTAPNSTANAGTPNAGTPNGASSAGSTAAAANPLVISATADSWVQVRGTGGTILFSRVLKAGQSWPVPDEPGLTLTTGNAGGTVLVQNGISGNPLGAAGAVLRNIPLTKGSAQTATPTGSGAGTVPQSAPNPATSGASAASH